MEEESELEEWWHSEKFKLEEWWHPEKFKLEDDKLELDGHSGRFGLEGSSEEFVAAERW